MAELEFTIPELTAVADIDMDNLASEVFDEIDMNSLASLVSDEIDVSQQVKDELDACEFVIPEDIERIKREISDELVMAYVSEAVMTYVRDYVAKELEAHHALHHQHSMPEMIHKIANMLSLFAKVSLLHVGNSEDSSS